MSTNAENIETFEQAVREISCIMDKDWAKSGKFTTAINIDAYVYTKEVIARLDELVEKGGELSEDERSLYTKEFEREMELKYPFERNAFSILDNIDQLELEEEGLNAYLASIGSNGFEKFANVINDAIAWYEAQDPFNVMNSKIDKNLPKEEVKNQRIENVLSIVRDSKNHAEHKRITTLLPVLSRVHDCIKVLAEEMRKREQSAQPAGNPDKPSAAPYAAPAVTPKTPR